mgnify:CR=1 FL=1
MMLEKGLSKHSIAAYKDDVAKLERWAQDREPELSPINLEYKHLAEFIIWINKLGLGAKSQARIISGIRAFFKYLFLENIITDDPSELVNVVKPVEQNPEVDNTAKQNVKPKKETMTEVVEQKQSSTIAENHVKSDTLTNTAASFTDLDPEQFDNEHFKPVNVVFILDVSSSMKQADRI